MLPTYVKSIKIFGFFFIVIISSGCGEKTSNKNNEALKEEIANRALKKVSDAEIMEAAYEHGKLIADSTQKIIFSELQNQLKKEDGIQESLKYCNVNAYSLTGSMSSEFNATIKRVSNKPRNKSNFPNELEGLLLDSYLYNVENDLLLEDNVQKVDDNYLLYTKPIVINSPLCLQCHGEAGKEITVENYKVIESLYPTDKAIGYKLGDFRGFWSIKLSKKELVKAL